MGLLQVLREQRATVINPLHPRDPALARMFGFGRDNVTGLRIDSESALSATAMFAGVRFISENMASVPLPLFRREGRGKQPLRDDRRWELLNNNPNPEQTAMELREMTIGFVCTVGNGYVEILEGSDGIADEFWPIPPWRVRPDRTAGGKLVYMVRGMDGVERPQPPERMLHFRGFSRNGLLGMDVVDAMRQALGITVAAERSAAVFYGHGAQLAGVLQTDSPLSDRAWERLKKERDHIHAGVDNWHRLAILEEGLKWTAMSTDPEKSQLVETRKFQVTEVARILNLPPHVLKDLERSTFSNIEHQGLELVTYSFRPWAVRMEQVYEKRLLLTRERSSHLIRHNLDAFLRGDLKSRYEAYATGRQWGWLSANDVLDREDENGIGPEGDVYMVPVNMLPAEQFENMPLPGSGDLPPLPEGNARRQIQPPKEERQAREQRSVMLRKRTEQAWERPFRQRMDGLVRREVNIVRNALGRAAQGEGVQEFSAWLDGFYEENEQYNANDMRPVFLGLAEAIFPLASDEIGAEHHNMDVTALVDGYTSVWAAREAGASWAQLSGIVSDNPLFEDARGAVEVRLDEWEEGRAGKQARREVVDLGSVIAMEAFRRAGRTRIRWHAVGDSCPLCNQMNGRVVGIGRPFLSPGDRVDPNDGKTTPLVATANVTAPGLHRGCDCTVIVE